MRLVLERLTLRLRSGVAVIDFSDVTVFHGKIGVGKSTIANLVDFCLGGTLRHETPALQEQWIETSLELRISDVPAAFARTRGSDVVRASWGEADVAQYVELPARKPGGVKVPDSQVEVLSDLIFHIARVLPPRVRKSKVRDDSELVRLSFRDLWGYCYLDQRSMDSTLFSLEPGADWARQLKSRDVVRFVLGVEHERLGELEAQLDELRARRRALTEGATLLLRTLEQTGIGTKEEITTRLIEATRRVELAEAALAELRGAHRSAQRHAVDDVRQRLRSAAVIMRDKESALSDAQERLAEEKRQRSELAILSTRFARVRQARAVLAEVEFVHCPRCIQALPARGTGLCALCGQPEPTTSDGEIEVASGDLRERIVEVERAITVRERALRLLRRETEGALRAKAELEQQLSRVVGDYDPIALSQLVLRERDLAEAQQEVKRYRQLVLLPERVDQMRADAAALEPREEELKDAIRKARAAAAEKRDRLEQLEALLLDCLVRAEIPGITAKDTVRIDITDLYPVVLAGGDSLRERDFLSLSSGGKTTVFKCCFALALHRLNAAVNGPLPTVLVMDTPMKNISERTNSEIFEAFYALVYDLAASELSGVQFVIIDKELRTVRDGFPRRFTSRLMTLNDPAHPPLIPGFTE